MSPARARFREVHIVLPVADVERSVRFFTEQLGFVLAFRDPSGPENYAGVRRDGVELHLQWQAPEDVPRRGTLQVRCLVDDPDALYAEYAPRGVLGERTQLRDTVWGTREFGFHDPDGNGLCFYRNL